MSQERKWTANSEELYAIAKKLIAGEMNLDEYLIHYAMPVCDLVTFAKQSRKFEGPEVRKLVVLETKSKDFEKLFDREEYREVYSILVNNKKVKPSEKQIDDCIAFVRRNGLYECDYHIRFVISCYLRNLIDVNGKNVKKELLKYKRELSILQAKRKAEKRKREIEYSKMLIKGDY